MSPIKIWRGNANLPKVFWIFGIFGEAIIVLPFLTLLMALTDVPDAQTAALLTTYLGFILVYTGWLFVGIWRCAGNYAIDNGFKECARFCVIGGSVIIVIFTWQIIFADVG